MHPIRSLLLYLLAVLTIGAVLAPWLYELTAWAGQSLSLCEELAKKPFHRFVNRSFLLVALAGLWPFLRSLRIDSWQAVGFVRPRGQWGRLGLGFLAGFTSLACIALVALAMGDRRMHTDPRWTRLLDATLSAAVVALLEELLFRGALFGAARRVYPWRGALILSSVVYAWVHFFQKPHSPTQVKWNSGFESLTQMLGGMLDVHLLVPAFLSLLLAGAALALAYQRTGNLYFSIGLHAGWVFWMRSYSVLTVASPGAGSRFAGSSKLIDGWLAVLVLGALLGVFAWVWRIPETPAPPRT